jgi:hypothetical protein
MAEQQPVFCDNSSNKSGHSAEKEEQIDSASLNSINEPIQSFNKIKKQESKSSITEQPGIIFYFLLYSLYINCISRFKGMAAT